MLHEVNIMSVINFEQVELWFSGQQELENPQDPDVLPVFDRQGKLKNVSYMHCTDVSFTPISVIMILKLCSNNDVKEISSVRKVHIQHYFKSCHAFAVYKTFW